MKRQPLTRLDADERSCLRAGRQPAWTEPMLATLTDERFSDPDWIFEPKLDGERVLAWRSGDKVRLRSRNRKDITATYPEIAAALEAQHGDFIVDGEVVAFQGRLTSFSRLQQRMHIRSADEARASGIPVFYYLFDIVYLDGFCLDDAPLRLRKRLLREAIEPRGALRLTSYRNEDGEAWFEEACARGWEGLIAKDANSRYVHRRSRAWLKFKCTKRQELVIGGYTAPRGSRKGFGALLVGYYDAGELRYAGKVGTGYDQDFLQSFRRSLDAIATDDPPFSGNLRVSGDVTWVRPRFVGEFGFTEWTAAGRLRHPRFLGLRRDKAAREVVRERA
jgi:bifunctional non-homologous end joining protein LigD